MADQKVDPNRPKDDPNKFATSAAPTADQPTQTPLGPETLEAQRQGFQQANAPESGVPQPNPLEVKGVEADVQNAVQNPEQSGPANTKKEDVVAQSETTKAAVQKQAQFETSKNKKNK
jgi:hypothetical protein